MGLFDSLSSLNLSVQTPGGTFGMSGGKINVGGFGPQLPEPTALTPAGSRTRRQIGQGSPALDWIRGNPLAVLGIAAAVLALVFTLRR
jgi:hypothetical protein